MKTQNKIPLKPKLTKAPQREKQKNTLAKNIAYCIEGKFKRSDVVSYTGLNYASLRARMSNPDKFTWGEIILMAEMFNMLPQVLACSKLAYTEENI